MKLTFIGNKIGDEGTGMISEALKTNKTLTALDLRCDRVNIKDWKQWNNYKW